MRSSSWGYSTTSLATSWRLLGLLYLGRDGHGGVGAGRRCVAKASNRCVWQMVSRTNRFSVGQPRGNPLCNTSVFVLVQKPAGSGRRGTQPLTIFRVKPKKQRTTKAKQSGDHPL